MPGKVKERESFNFERLMDDYSLLDRFVARKMDNELHNVSGLKPKSTTSLLEAQRLANPSLCCERVS